MLLTLLISFLVLELSSFGPAGNDFLYPLRTIKPAVIALNLGSVGIIWLFFLLLTNRVWLSCSLTSGLCGIVGIINFFVINRHGMPLSFLVLKNFQTAMNVLTDMNFVFDPAVIELMLYTGIPCGLSVLCGLLLYRLRLPRLRGRAKWLRNGVLITMAVCIICVGYLGENPIKPKRTLAWAWHGPYSDYGYIPCTIESYFQTRRVVNIPDNYDQDAMDAVSVTPRESAGATPDIILILNESFYDLGQIIPLSTDIAYLENYNTMEDLLTGYAVVPQDGGGTNCSEYELLTSNSLQLMPGVTPFNALDLSDDHSIVTHMNALGYYTIGSHTEEKHNYNRSVAYPALGFDQVHFRPDFQNLTYYGQRQFPTDESAYENIIRWYENAPADSPRFSYLLTMQNHTGWVYNPDEDDYVHNSIDYGEYNAPINEFLSCVYLSDNAFRSLTEYFAQADRPVIICMVGDHSPDFASNVVSGSYTTDETTLQLRKTPLMIWANFDLPEQELGTMSMNMVVPTLLDLAGVSLSPYYEYLLQVKEDVPVLSSFGKYYDRDGNMYAYDSDEGGALEALVDTYFHLEYQNLMTKHHRELYLPVE